MKKILLAKCFLGFAGTVCAQIPLNKDSLLYLLPKSKPDTALVSLYIAIGQQYEGSQPDSAAYYYFKARDLSRSLKFVAGEVRFISNYTYLLNMQGKADSSLLLNLRSVELAGPLKDDALLAAAHGNTGASYQHLNQLDSAVVHYIISEKHAEKTGNKRHIIVLNSNLAALYNTLGQYDKGLKHASKSVALARQLKNPLLLAQALLNNTNILSGLRRHKEAIRCVREAIALTKQTGDNYTREAALLSLGNEYLQTLQFDKVKAVAEEALKLGIALDDKNGQAIALRGLALYSLYRNDFKRSRENALASLALGKQIGNRETEYKAYKILADNELVQRRYPEYARYAATADSIESSLRFDELNEKAEAYTILYETEKKDQQLKLQDAVIRQKSLFNYLLAGGTITLVVIFFLLYRNYRHKQKWQQQRIDDLEREKQLAATEAVLKGEEQERARLAKDLHDGLGGMLSGIKFSLNTMKENLVMTPDNAKAFERSLDMLDSSIREMRRVAHNMMPESLIKFGLDTALRDFCNEVSRSGALQVSYQSIGLDAVQPEQTVSIAIYRIVQELLNNAVKHASAQNVLVQIAKTDDILSITVEDDGKGFDTSLTRPSGGMGWSNIRSRVEFIKGKADVHSEPGKGTSVLIELPL